MEKVDRPLGPVVVDIAGTSLTDEEVKILQNPMVGMVILFTRNYENREQLHNLTHDIHSLRNPSLLNSAFPRRVHQDPVRSFLGPALRYGSAKSSQSDSCLRFSDGF